MNPAYHTEPNQLSSESFLLTKQELAHRIGVSTRLIEKWTQNHVIPSLRVGSRLTRFELPRVLEALRAYETKTLNHKK